MSNYLNTKTDQEKHVEAFENHLEALWGEGWEQLTAKEVCKLLAKKTLGLNGGPLNNVGEAAERVGFENHNIVMTSDGPWQVLTMIEFDGPQPTSH